MLDQTPLRLIKAGLTPLIDVVFLLLLFFLVGLQPAEGQLEAYMPRDKSLGVTCTKLTDIRVKLLWHDLEGKPTTDDAGAVTLKLGEAAYNKPGELELEEHPAWQRLYQDILEHKRALPGREFILDARPQVPYSYVARALNELSRAGIAEVTFAAPERKF